MSMFTITVILLSLGYAALLVSAAVGFVRVAEPRDNAPPRSDGQRRANRQGRYNGQRRSNRLDGVSIPPRTPTVTVVIPARNEQRSIGACIDSILANDYPSGKYEVIVVDDGSTDGTAAIVQRYCRALVHAGDRAERSIVEHFLFEAGDIAADDSAGEGGPAVRLIAMPENDDRSAAHKKFALARGVAEAQGEIILTTDADCTVVPSWIRSMTARFGPETGMVTGPVLYRDDGSIFGRIQSLEFIGLVALGAGFIGINRPHLCNSANLAYRRDAYEEVGGYEGNEDVSTGDDEMLLHKMAYESPWDTDTCMEERAAVETNPCASISEFCAQRTRWASAHARYPHRHLTAVSVGCYLFFASLVACALTASWELLAGALVLKIASEASVLWPAARRFGRSKLLPLIIPAQVLHIPYVLFVGIAGTFGGYEWKGRRLDR